MVAPVADAERLPAVLRLAALAEAAAVREREHPGRPRAFGCRPPPRSVHEAEAAGISVDEPGERADTDTAPMSPKEAAPKPIQQSECRSGKASVTPFTPAPGTGAG